MNKQISKERQTTKGVVFSVMVDCDNYACLVPNEALSGLIKLSARTIEPLDAYAAYKTKIHSVAKRLISAGIGGSPVVLRSGHF